MKSIISNITRSMALVAGLAVSFLAPDSRAEAQVPLEIKTPNGLCLDVEGGTAANGTRLITFGCHGQANQRFALHADGTLRVGGQCLDVEGGNATSGARVITYACHGRANQKWRIHHDRSIRTIGGLCLDVQGANTNPGTPLIAYTCHGRANQQFTISNP